MRKADIVFVCAVVAVFLPFVLSEPVYEAYKSFNAAHGMIVSFIKFAVLSTAGEMLGARISTGRYYYKGFGLVSKMIVWGILGMGINMAMIIFSTGTPAFLEYMGLAGATEYLAGPMCWQKVLVAFCVSVAMNSIFAPVFMTLHKICDIHIADCPRFGKAMEDGRADEPRQLEGPVGLCLQEDHSALLVSRAYGDLPAAALRPCPLRRPARGRPRSAPGCGRPQEITRQMFVLADINCYLALANF